MGSTLTNTQPKDTYKSLLKTSDSSELSATAKYVSDGNGNDSALALSTSNVGIGTSLPSDKLSVYTTTDYGNNSEYANATIGLGNQTYPVSIRSYRYGGSYLNGLDLYYNDGTPKLGLRIASSGKVGIGTDSPNRELTVNGEIQATNIVLTGSAYLGGTAAANALDDYEEGFFTPNFAPITGDFASISYITQYGKYTKIGNRVDVNIQITVASVSVGTAGGVISITGLPFTVGAKPCPFSITIVQDWASGKFPINGFFNDGAANCLLRYLSSLNANDAYIGGADITSSSQITLSGTYFV